MRETRAALKAMLDPAIPSGLHPSASPLPARSVSRAQYLWEFRNRSIFTGHNHETTKESGHTLFVLLVPAFGQCETFGGLSRVETTSGLRPRPTCRADHAAAEVKFQAGMNRRACQLVTDETARRGGLARRVIDAGLHVADVRNGIAGQLRQPCAAQTNRMPPGLSNHVGVLDVIANAPPPKKNSRAKANRFAARVLAKAIRRPAAGQRPRA
jgi:hypothetical protein